MSNSIGSPDEVQELKHEEVATLEADAIHLCHDEHFVYIGCRDNRVRVWSKRDWKLEAVLGETTTSPLRVQVDDAQVYATCEKRVYVWKKGTWGMIGWFELGYQAVTSILYDNFIYVGAKDGRLLSITKDSHETSSWQLYKTDIISLWRDGEVICTVARKDDVKVWSLSVGKAPIEIIKLSSKERGVKVFGNESYILVGLSTGEVRLWDRFEWTSIRNLIPNETGNIVTLWANRLFAIVAYDSENIIIWDIKRGSIIGYVLLDDVRIDWIVVDHDFIYVASPTGVLAIQIQFEGHALDLSSDKEGLYELGVLSTSPYDILEMILELQNKGDSFLKTGEYHKAVTEYENALQKLIDNGHTLLEVPSEREKLTTELNSRLGKALLRSKIEEVQGLASSISDLKTELETTGRAEQDEREIEKLWSEVARALREGRVLSEAQADNILSYQLSEICDSLDSEYQTTKDEFEKYRERINEAYALSSSIMSEWRWLERRRTNLDDRKQFLQTTIEDLTRRISGSETDEEVTEILQQSLEEFQKLLNQIDRILTASDSEIDEVILEPQEAQTAIQSMLKILPKKLNDLSNIDNASDWGTEHEKMIEALQQALETANKHKIKALIPQVEKALELVSSLSYSPD